MGCGASRFDAPCCKAKTTRINPRLHHRIEELKRRRCARSLNKVTPSKKVLLRHHSDVEDVREIISDFTPLSEKSANSREDIESFLTSEDSKKPSEKIEDLTLKLNEKNVPFIEGVFEGNVGDDQKVEKAKNQSDNAEDGDEEEDGSIDDERRNGNNDGFFPGSPSFRIYYIESVVDDKKKDQSDEENQQLKESTNNAQNVALSELAETLKLYCMCAKMVYGYYEVHLFFISGTMESENSSKSQDSTTVAKKKGWKRRGFAKNMMRRNIRCY